MRKMKTKIIISSSIVLIIIFVFLKGGYYLINPDLRGEDILSQQGIPTPTVIAHRGFSLIAPESTRPAYEKARDIGVDYLEADVQRTSDGELIIFHDETLTRSSNIDEVYPEQTQKEVGEFTYEELKKLDFGSWFNDKYPHYASSDYRGLNILKLKDLIHIAREGNHTPGLILESKHPEKYPGIEKEIVQVLKEENWLNNKEINDFPKVSNSDKTFANTIFFSYSKNSLQEFKNIKPEIPRLLLITDTMISQRSWDSWLDTADKLADGLGVKGFMIWPWHRAAAHERKKFVFPYTINKLWQINILANFQSSGYITDHPKLVLSFLERLPDLPEFTELTENK